MAWCKNVHYLPSYTLLHSIFSNLITGWADDGQYCEYIATSLYILQYFLMKGKVALFVTMPRFVDKPIFLWNIYSLHVYTTDLSFKMSYREDISAYIPAQHSLNIELKCCAQHWVNLIDTNLTFTARGAYLYVMDSDVRRRRIPTVYRRSPHCKSNNMSNDRRSITWVFKLSGKTFGLHDLFAVWTLTILRMRSVVFGALTVFSRNHNDPPNLSNITCHHPPSFLKVLAHLARFFWWI